ncbi:hypothetical protein MKX01_039289, partial [Papaver californicum]
MNPSFSLQSSFLHRFLSSFVSLCVHPQSGGFNISIVSAALILQHLFVAEEDPDLRRSAFKPNSPDAKAVVDQVLKVIENGDSDLLIPCIKAMGHLARTFKATERRII